MYPFYYYFYFLYFLYDLILKLISTCLGLECVRKRQSIGRRRSGCRIATNTTTLSWPIHSSLSTSLCQRVTVSSASAWLKLTEFSHRDGRPQTKTFPYCTLIRRSCMPPLYHGVLTACSHHHATHTDEWHWLNQHHSHTSISCITSAWECRTGCGFHVSFMILRRQSAANAQFYHS